MEKFLRYDIKPEYEIDKTNYAKLVIDGLEKGFGTTLGNALRRIALTNIPGASMFAIKIPSITHEFSPIVGLKEDVTHIILNLKKAAIKIDNNIYSEEELNRTKIENWPTLKLNFKGPKIIYASDIVCPTGIEIVNGDLQIATVTEDINFEMEIYVNTGRGYLSSHDSKLDVNSLSIISTDSDYCPVKFFNYSVEEIKSTKLTSNDRLTLELATNGTIKASDALAISAKILEEHLQPLISINEQIAEWKLMNEKSEENKKTNLFIVIEELDLTVRAYNALKAAGIHTLHQLTEKSKPEVEKIKNLGRKSVSEIIAKIHERGLKLRGEN